MARRSLSENREHYVQRRMHTMVHADLQCTHRVRQISNQVKPALDPVASEWSDRESSAVLDRPILQ